MHALHLFAVLAAIAISPGAFGSNPINKDDCAKALDRAALLKAVTRPHMPPLRNTGVDPKTGFDVGGVNKTSLIRTVTELNGIPIAELEKSMRPGSRAYSGFLGPEESLIEVLAADNDLVLGLGLTHQQIALALEKLIRTDVSTLPSLDYEGAIFRRAPGTVIDVVDAWNVEYNDEPLVLGFNSYLGYVSSPFGDYWKSANDYAVYNRRTKQSFKFSHLHIAMIYRYGFYEGKNVPYRLNPLDVIQVLNLKP